MRKSELKYRASRADPGGARKRQRGFSMIEMAIGLVIVSVLLALGIPSFKAWVLNSQIRDGAEAILNGIQVARANAIQRNALVRFDLTPTAGNVSWAVRTDDGVTLIQQWSSAEGAAKTAVTPNADATRVTFNGLGQRVTNTDNTTMLSQVDVSSSASTSADVRPLRVTIGAAGSPKMCDPSLASTDPRSC